MTTTDAERLIEYRDAVNEALFQEMERDPNVIVMGEDIAGGAGRAHLGFIDAWGGAYRTTRGLIQIDWGSIKVTPAFICASAIRSLRRAVARASSALVLMPSSSVGSAASTEPIESFSETAISTTSVR